LKLTTPEQEAQKARREALKSIKNEVLPKIPLKETTC
jgi:hypothetical protein